MGAPGEVRQRQDRAARSGGGVPKQRGPRHPVPRPQHFPLLQGVSVTRRLGVEGDWVALIRFHEVDRRFSAEQSSCVFQIQRHAASCLRLHLAAISAYELWKIVLNVA